MEASGKLNATVASGSSLPLRVLGKSYDGHAVSSRLRHRLRSALIRMFGKLFHLLLLMAPELRLAPLHALHDTSSVEKRVYSGLK